MDETQLFPDGRAVREALERIDVNGHHIEIEGAIE